jgi:DNA polymerase I-like protein with 3'-5' exonuclease and polymerase domains
VPGINYEFVANVHDEWQIEVDEEHGEAVGKLAVQAIRKAGECFKFKCPLDGEYGIGRNWAETH